MKCLFTSTITCASLGTSNSSKGEISVGRKSVSICRLSIDGSITYVCSSTFFSMLASSDGKLAQLICLTGTSRNTHKHQVLSAVILNIMKISMHSVCYCSWIKTKKLDKIENTLHCELLTLVAMIWVLHRQFFKMSASHFASTKGVERDSCLRIILDTRKNWAFMSSSLAYT